MTGMRSWTAEVTAFGVVVRMEQVFTQLPLVSFQRSHIPAKANNSPPFTSKQNGCLALPSSLPFIETVCGNEAPAVLQRITKCGLRGCCFRPCVDHSCPDGRVFRPRRNEPPAHQT